MTLYSYVSRRIEDGGWTGVSRFDSLLRRVFHGLRSVTAPPAATADDVVITDNHLSCELPPEARAVVVHHGCARTHYERDPAWRTDRTRHIVELQGRMLVDPNRKFVAPSAWVAGEFKGNGTPVIPHWVEMIERLPRSGPPVIIGDWRDNNKGYSVWRNLADRCPNWTFQPLSFRDEAGRRKQYGEASLYLCLSLSEGGSYSMCDAEAAELPIVTTDVGNCLEFVDAEVIPWQKRGNVDLVIDAIDRKLKAGRQVESFYQSYAFDSWKADWERVI